MTFTGTQPGGLLKTSGWPLGRPHPSGDLLPATARRPSPARPGAGGNRRPLRPAGTVLPPPTPPRPAHPRHRLTALVSARRRAPNSRDTARTPDISVLQMAVPPAPAPDCACASSRARPGRWDTAPVHHATTPGGGGALRLRTGPADSGSEGIPGPALPAGG